MRVWRSALSQSLVNTKEKRMTMSKEIAQKTINYILRELLEHKDCVSKSSVVHMEGHLYEDVAKDIETYLNKETHNDR